MLCCQSFLKESSGVMTAVQQRYDVQKVREDFPILSERINGKPLVYLDNANTTQKPLQVIDAISNYYKHMNSNIHRATHVLGERATLAYEGTRGKVRDFLNASSTQEIVFVRNATEGVNLVANTFGKQNIHEGDEILISEMEHHANIVPWQMLCDRVGARLVIIPIDDTGDLILDNLDKLINTRTKLVGIVQMSNVLGTINPVEEIIRIAHSKGVPVLVDAAQSAYHMPIDVQRMDCDFLVFSGHKLYGPTGSGVLYGKKELLENMDPWQGGGDMILSVSFEKTVYNDIPYRFEAGTPNIAGGVGLGAAIDYITNIGMENIAQHESDLMSYGTEVLQDIDGLRMIGTSRHKASVFSFVLDDVHPHDIGTMLDSDGIAIRTGQHCAHPLLARCGVPATARASIACYNTREEIDALAASIRRVQEFFS